MENSNLRKLRMLKKSKKALKDKNYIPGLVRMDFSLLRVAAELKTTTQELKELMESDKPTDSTKLTKLVEPLVIQILKANLLYGKDYPKPLKAYIEYKSMMKSQPVTPKV